MSTPPRARSWWSYLRVLKDKVVGFYYNGWGGEVDRIYGPNSTGMHLSTIARRADKIMEGLYLGNAFDAADEGLLEDLEISSIVNATSEIGNYFEGQGRPYFNTPILDSAQASIAPYFDDFLTFMNSHQGENILIHCYMGSSRSATLALLYIVYKTGATIDQALELLKERRPAVNINRRFLDELRTYVANLETNAGMVHSFSLPPEGEGDIEEYSLTL